jgi:hypothetical protein
MAAGAAGAAKRADFDAPHANIGAKSHARFASAGSRGEALGDRQQREKAKLPNKLSEQS